MKPDKDGNWTKLSENDFKDFIPLADKKTKAVKVATQERAIFRLYSLGVSTNRDEWLYDFDRNQLTRKCRYLVSQYNRLNPKEKKFPKVFKWSRNLKRRLHQGRKEPFSANRIVKASYRPYATRWLYHSDLFIDEAGASAQMFPPGERNTAICFSDINSRTNYSVLAVHGTADLHFGAAVDGFQQVPRFRYADGVRTDNITDWALQQFVSNYAEIKPTITKDEVFHYVYAVLHDPIYREKYALNLEREYPHIPFYPDFRRWADWGGELMEFHVGYEKVKPWPLKRTETKDKKAALGGVGPKTILRTDSIHGIIVLDSETQLSGVPASAWEYRLGNRCGLEWILDQHKEKKPKDPTIREKFNTYRFADYKEKVIDLLARVTRVSVETMAIVEAMKSAER